ncbi:MAG: S8 family serine peptidase [Bryobacterales bacterium]|nr:S8 family serine peptidase [Bryobacterales bacterium]
MRTQQARFLVKTGGADLRAARKLGAAGNQFELASTWKLGAGAEGWAGYELRAQATVAELWDAAHERARDGLVIEPDCENLWPVPATKAQRGLFAGGPDEDRGIENAQSGRFPRALTSDGKDRFAWHLDDDYSALRSARSGIQNPHPVRAAILDVGFDFKHEAMPRGIRKDLQKNFSGDGKPDAADPDRKGLLKNPGHGTATIALLAGGPVKRLADSGILQGPIGGAPEIEVVPLRVADSVLMLKTSAFAEAIEYLLTLQRDASTAVDVVSMSMGGVASRLWADVVNRAYDEGIVLVTAAGNNYGRPKSIVYPARFRRVLAACGIMANEEPYVLSFGTMSGNYGPSEKMKTAIAAFTPNISWAEIDSRDIIDSDGEGTSSATPQVAAAAALWLQKHKAGMTGWPNWQKVEMVRKALCGSADRNFPDCEKYFGCGVLKADRAMAVAPTQAARRGLSAQQKDSAALAFFKILRGSVFSATDREGEMDASFNLELTQLLHRDPNLEELIGDAGADGLFAEGGNPARARAFADGVIESPYASRELKRVLRMKAGGAGKQGRGSGAGLGRSSGDELFDRPAGAVAAGTRLVADRLKERAPMPSARRLRVFAFDPSAGATLEEAAVKETTVAIPWEPLAPGPSGEYIEVVDHDPASGCFYPPVDLESPYLVATDGCTPEEGNPSFHQQMVYGVAMRTIQSFEKALGRKVLWSPVMDGREEKQYVRKLRLYPHALRARNAYYNPLKKAVLFGYFPSTPAGLAGQHPGGMVFTCLSHDVVAHEMTHAILDGVARDLVRPTNPDMLAFHEAFADLVAIFQHFSLPGILEKELARTRGSLRTKSLLVELARQFGEGIGLHGALRSYLGQEPDAAQYARSTEPHARGAVLVAALFDAFVSIYESRIRDLGRIASDGTGVLRDGELHPDLIRRFADEAARAANHLLRMCIRALDYCPPCDLTFGDYLRALITLDSGLFPDDPLRYRVALIEAFRARGIYPHDVRTLSEDSLRWRRPSNPTVTLLNESGIMRRLLARMSAVGDIVRRIANAKGNVPWPLPDLQALSHWDLDGQRDIAARARTIRAAAPVDQFGNGGIPAREAIYQMLKLERIQTKHMLDAGLAEDRTGFREHALEEAGLLPSDGSRRGLEVHALNFADRENAEGRTEREFLLWIKRRDHSGFEGGATIVGNCDTGMIRYIVRKSLSSKHRAEAEQDFHVRGQAMGFGRGFTYFAHSPFSGPGSRFAMIHSEDQIEEAPHA